MDSELFKLEATPEPHQEVLEFNDQLYYQAENTPIGWLRQLALDKGDWTFTAIHKAGDTFNLTHPTGLSFDAELKEGRGAMKGSYSIRGCVTRTNDKKTSFFEGVNLHGRGKGDWKLRPAQLGAVHSLLAHWSLSTEPATVVLPTGTGKTETMLVTTLVDQAARTLVIVPTKDLKDQIAEKFMSWGMLRRLGVIPSDAPNPKVLVLSKTITDASHLDHINSADVVVATPALLARAPQTIKSKLRKAFSHVYFDEAHHVVAVEWDGIKSLFSKSKIVQFTATPYRNDRKPIEGNLIYNYPLSLALADKCFSPISLVAVDERHPRKKDQAIADAAMARLNEDRANGLTRHRMMVRAETQTKADALYKKYQEWFPKERIALVHSGIKGRRAIVEQIKEGEFDLVVCVDMLKEGFDYPDFKIAAVHGVHKSLAVLLQFIGRFTRTQKGLGDASFVVNYAAEKISLELEDLFQEGSGWEHVIKEIADAKKNEAESLLAFLQGCQPYSGFDSPDIELNPKLVYPALSCVCYQCSKVDWAKFNEAFNLKKYALSQPYINPDENVFYFTTQKREKVKWARTKELRDQTWDLIVIHHDSENKMLYVGFSEKRLDVDNLVEKISAAKPRPLKGDRVFRSFDSIKRLCIVHAGIFKPANHLHRYSRLSGADVTTELTRWKTEGRCDKSDFVGVGFRYGFPVSVGASVKGKIWSPARVGDLKQWKEWCLAIGAMVTNEKIDSNLLLEDSAKKIELKEYPDDVVVLAADWSDGLYDRIHKLTLEIPKGGSMLLAESSLKFKAIKGTKAELILFIGTESHPFSILLGGEKGHCIEGLETIEVQVAGLKADPVSLTQFFQENPPALFLLNGCTISGCIHTDYGEGDIHAIPHERIESLPWGGVDFKIESIYKGSTQRKNSIQEYMMKRLVDTGARVVFNDDNAGESADIVAVFVEDGLVRFELVHCKYSKATAGARLSDLYEVCGQAIVSLRYKWKPEELIKHLERRNATGVLKNKRFYHGSSAILEEIKKALKYSDVLFEFSIAQPGVESSSLTPEMKRLLGSVYSTVVEMTETKLRCYFS
ncbi:DEAD/DEAH box helicase family protein [Verrucomicrobiaceae bacterium 5K15]|uniref:DEAD/DEAH box helicase family protein n=1 Tax=Oceaniferula flava TaxID=2800421 RepID=A0AAE2VCU4_9BACT|nr:DEAD/DEAH box helicase family protein [Oceaniferula flavus]MBK1856035.1 DEAD/DEAH box helicase family protein [Oceaniferula flavus]MBM1137342.1 DEAD/DEAH box helicase family protein [Oceaniferula flavus]